MKNEEKRCQYEYEIGNIEKKCSRQLLNGDDECCLFHSENINGKKDIFEEAFWKEFDRQEKEESVFDFYGFIFPCSISFFGREFNKSTYFSASIFNGPETIFDSVKFYGEVVDFSSITIKGKKASFNHSLFDGKDTNFSYSQFSSINISFFNSKFLSPMTTFFYAKFTGKKIDFSNSKFKGEDIGFNDSDYKGEEILFKEVKFLNNNGITEFKNTKFHGDTFFNKAEFSSKTTEISNARFSGKKLSFLGSKFTQGRIIFDRSIINVNLANFSLVKSEAEFFSFGETIFRSQKTTFHGAKFLKGAINFNSAQFSGDEILFSEVLFAGTRTEFRSTNFLGKKTDFSGTQFSADITDFDNSQFSGEENNLYNAYFENVEKLFDIGVLKKKTKNPFKKNKYKINNFKFLLGDKSSARYPILDRKAKDDWYLDKFSEEHPHLHWWWWLLADCGRSIGRWAMWSIAIVIFFAANYSMTYKAAFHFNEHIISKPDFFSYLYYSIVTFTTLGFGDVIPRLGWAQFMVALEVITGYVMLGGLISILAVKIARRS